QAGGDRSGSGDDRAKRFRLGSTLDSWGRTLSAWLSTMPRVLRPIGGWGRRLLSSPSKRAAAYGGRQRTGRRASSTRAFRGLLALWRPVGWDECPDRGVGLPADGRQGTVAETDAGRTCVETQRQKLRRFV